MACKRKSLCIDEKVSLIRAIETGEKINDVGRRFGFSRSTVFTIWKNKEKILQADDEGKCSKKLKKPKYENLDQCMLSWFHRQRQNNLPISGPIVKAKAMNFAEELGLTSFKASEGWLGKFKRRHHINYGKTNGEARSADTNASHDWINRVWSNLTDKYASSDIFNADDTGIFYKFTQEQRVEGEEADEPEPPPSVNEALEAAKVLEKYFSHQQDASLSEEMNKIMNKIQQNYCAMAQEQMSPKKNRLYTIAFK